MTKLFETAASLTIIGDDLDPDYVTAMLGKQPDWVAYKGRECVRPSGAVWIPKKSRWFVEVPREVPGNLDKQIRELFDGATNDLDVWQEITSQNEARVFCGLFLNEWNEWLSIAADTLRSLSERGVLLDLDIYAPEEDDAESS